MPAAICASLIKAPATFQTRDWVDVYAGRLLIGTPGQMHEFQTRDWVDVYAGDSAGCRADLFQAFQTRDWVDVYAGKHSSDR